MPRKTILFTAFVSAILALILAGHGDGPVMAGTVHAQRLRDLAGELEASDWQWPDHAAAGPRGHQGHGPAKCGQCDAPVRLPTTTYTLGQDIQDGELEDSMLTFHVRAQNAPVDRVNVTLTVSGDTMTGTVCGHTCGKMSLKKSPF